MPRNIESRQPTKEPARFTSMDDLFARYPNQRVAVAFTQGVGTQKEGIVIAHGSKRVEKKLALKLRSWMDQNPGKQVGWFYTGTYPNNLDITIM